MLRPTLLSEFIYCCHLLSQNTVIDFRLLVRFFFFIIRVNVGSNEKHLFSSIFCKVTGRPYHNTEIMLLSANRTGQSDMEIHSLGYLAGILAQSYL